MKKILFMAAVTAVALSSCSKDETMGTPANEQKEISFSTYVGTTKATDVTSDNLVSFEVYAEYKASSEGTAVDYFTTGVERTSSTASWYTDKTFYWPTSGALSFYAYNDDLGYGVVVEGLTSTTKTLSFTTTDATQDLVVASSLDNDVPTSTASAVSLTFAHALTKVSLGFLPDVATPDGTNNGVDVDDDANYRFKISSITLTGAASGTYTYGVTDGDAWSSTSTIDLTFEDGDYISGDADDATSSTGEFLLVPYTNATATFVVKYTVEHLADDDTTTWVEIADHTKSATVDVQAAGVNTKYVLSLPIDGEAISFTTEDITTWGDATADPTTGGTTVVTPAVGD